MKVIFKKYFDKTDDFVEAGELSLIDNILQWTKEPDEGIKHLIDNGMFVDTISGFRQMKMDEDPIEFLRAIPENLSYASRISAELVGDNISKSFGMSITPEVPGELRNQVGYPVKVNAVKEIQERTPQRDNSEPYFEKSIINDWFYSEDNLNSNTALANLKLEFMNKGIYDDKRFSDIVEIVRKSNTLFQMKRRLDEWEKKID